MVSTDVDAIVARVHAQYAACACAFKPSNDYQYTVLAAFVLARDLPSNNDGQLIGGPDLKVVSLATGSKCLPAARYSPGGDALHDSHAEVLARRGLVRWLYDEVSRAVHAVSGSEWIEQSSGGRWALKTDATLHMYISTVPCGDASTRFLASSQDPAMAALKDSAPPAALPPGTATRGRNNYALFGVLRTKPGRADSPPTLCMSCSDKIASWSVIGVQGALASSMFAPIYVCSVVISDVPEEMREVVREDCERAFYRRLEGIKNLPEGFRLSKPDVQFTSTDFVLSRTALHALHPHSLPPPSSNESLCWFAGMLTGPEVVINGTRRGVGAKQRGLERSRPRLCKLQFFRLHVQIMQILDKEFKLSDTTYHRAKRSDVAFQLARSALKGPDGPFAGWVISGEPWESFGVEGEIIIPDKQKQDHADDS